MTLPSRPQHCARPFVRLKMAASLDGITALPDGRSQWITSPEARADGHRWRARADCILTGIGTVLADDPRLDVRLPAGAAPASATQPTLVVIDSLLRTPPTAALFTASRPVLLLATQAAPHAREAALCAAGAGVRRLPSAAAAGGRVDLGAAFGLLAREGVATAVHVEAGAALGGALLRAGLVDELLLYLAPMLLGEGRGMAVLGALPSLADGVSLAWESVDRIGPDLRIVARVLRVV